MGDIGQLSLGIQELGTELRRPKTKVPVRT